MFTSNYEFDPNFSPEDREKARRRQEIANKINHELDSRLPPGTDYYRQQGSDYATAFLVLVRKGKEHDELEDAVNAAQKVDTSEAMKVREGFIIYDGGSCPTSETLKTKGTKLVASGK